MTFGFFITLEGGEGAGKTTQISHLKAALEKHGHEVVVTREPGGTPESEAVRELLSHNYYGPKWSPDAETMLLFAARAMHIRDVIAPALNDNKVVICDRYVDSTRVYQGIVQKIDPVFLQCLEVQIIGKLMPDLTIVLDISSEETMKRIEARGGVKDHYDEAGADFHEMIRQGFLDIAQLDPDRCRVINAEQEEQLIAEQIKKEALDILHA
ncbi:MAG: dTMP kinase [Pseudomonadota bacterium]